jgi:hypothetical protein
MNIIFGNKFTENKTGISTEQTHQNLVRRFENIGELNHYGLEIHRFDCE